MGQWLFLTILVVGAVQGIVLGVLLWRGDTRRNSANRWLAAILFFIAYRLLTIILRHLGVISVDQISYHLFLEYNWIYGALLFLYVRAYVKPGLAWKKSDYLHFAPVGLQFLISNFIKTQNFFWDGSRESLSWAGYYGYITWVQTPLMHVVAFGLVVFYALQSRKMLRNTSADIPWLHNLLTAFLIAGLILPVLAITDYLFFNYAFNPFYIYPLYIVMALLLYWLGLAGFIHRDDPLPKAPDQAQRVQWTDIIDRLDRKMKTGKLFLQPELGIEDVADAIGEKPYRISQALNRLLEKSFTDYLNELRVAEFRRLLSSEAHQAYSLLALGYEAGFNSKSSFYRAVRKITGKSPSELRAMIKNKSA